MEGWASHESHELMRGSKTKTCASGEKKMMHQFSLRSNEAFGFDDTFLAIGLGTAEPGLGPMGVCLRLLLLKNGMTPIIFAHLIALVRRRWVLAASPDWARGRIRPMGET